MTRAPEPQGFALIMALAAILLASALMVAVNYGVQTDSALARSGTLRRLAIATAETATWNAVDAEDVTRLRTDPIGTSRRSVATDGHDSTVVTVTKTDTTTVWIVANASILRGSQRARHTAGVSVVIPRDTARTALVPIARMAWVESF